MPLQFSQLIGNQKASAILTRLLLSSSVPNVLLFHGPSGVGKGLFAEAVAHCLVGSTQKCHPDIHVVYPDSQSKQHLIATMRSIVYEALLPPLQSPSKCFLLHDVEKMAPASGNVLLKTLEEPLPNTYFILITSELGSVLPTLCSRCSAIPFFPVSEKEIEHFLQQNFPAADGKKIALLSHGSVARAIQRVQQNNYPPVEPLFQIRNYEELCTRLKAFEEAVEKVAVSDSDSLWEEILFWIRENDPLRLEIALPLIQKARFALARYVRWQHGLEYFFLHWFLSTSYGKMATTGTE